MGRIKKIFKNQRRFSELLLYFFIFVFCVTSVFVFSLYTLRTLTSPYWVYFTEGHVLSLARLAAENGTYFFDIHDYPFMHGAYPPVYVFLSAFFVKIFGPSFFFGRMISLCAAAGVLLLLFFAFRKRSSNTFLVLFLSFLFLIPDFTIHWSTYFRIDMLAVFFSLAGVLLYDHYYKKNDNKMFLSAAVLVIAGFTKHNYIFGALSILLFSFLKNKKDFVRFLTLYGLLGTAVFVYFNYVTGGEFYKHMITYTTFMPLHPERIPGIYGVFILKNIPLLFLVAINIFFVKKNRLFTIYFLVNFAFLFLASKEGADKNYFLLPYVSLLLVSGLTLFELMKKYGTERVRLMVLLSALFLAAAHFPYYIYFDLARNPFYPPDQTMLETVDRYVGQADGPVLSEDAGFIAANNTEQFLEAYQLLWLRKYGLWDTGKLVRDCRNKKYALVITGVTIAEMRELYTCIQQEYTLVEDIKYKVYLPNP